MTERSERSMRAAIPFLWWRHETRVAEAVREAGDDLEARRVQRTYVEAVEAADVVEAKVPAAS